MNRAKHSDVSELEALFVSELATIERVIAFVCARNHLSAADADDFASHVKLKLVNDDYAVLGKLEQPNRLAAFLSVVVQHLFLDYRISAWGKWRPSAEAKRAGPIGVLLEQLMARDGYAFEEACELLWTNHRATESRAALEAIAGRLPPRVRRRVAAEDGAVRVPAGERSSDDVAADAERQATADRVSTVMQALFARISAQDALILALRFEDGRQISEIATVLKLPPAGLYPRVQRLLHELRRGLEDAGIDARAAFESLESPAVSLEWKIRP